MYCRKIYNLCVQALETCRKTSPKEPPNPTYLKNPVGFVPTDLLQLLPLPSTRGLKWNNTHILLY